MNFMHFEKYQLILENADWSLTFNIADIWHKYSSGELSITDFCKLYRDYMLKKKNDIVKLYNNEAWVKLDSVIQKLNNVTDEKASHNIFDSIYDWADNHDVLIQTNTEMEEF
jgi:hypothetical protein